MALPALWVSRPLATARNLMLAVTRIAAASAAAAIGLLQAQTLPPPTYTYEVVSVHRSDPAERNSGFGPGAQGGLRARNNTTMQMLTFAFDARDYQFVGAPNWAQTERFEVNLTPDRTEIIPDATTGLTQIQGWFNRNRQRMQAVLRDRFGLVLRAETRELPCGVLTIAKGGHKLASPADPNRGPSFNINNGRQIRATSATMKMLADSLSQLLGRYVRDETGLEGQYDFKMEWTPDSTVPLPAPVQRPDEQVSAGDPGRISIFTALIQQLGLRVDSKRGPVPVFVIEKIEKPTEN